MVNRLLSGQTQVTVLNFCGELVEARVQASEIPTGRVIDLTSGMELGDVDELGGFSLPLGPYQAAALVVDETPAPPRPVRRRVRATERSKS